MESHSEKKEVLKILKENYNNYIVKPQKEGGSHNYYGEEVLTLLPENLEGEEEINPILNDAIIMEKIKPPTFTSYILRENKLMKSECISEISSYGIILSQPEERCCIINKSSGFLIRSKLINCNEGGIANGSSAVDLPALIDLNLTEEKEINFKC